MKTKKLIIEFYKNSQHQEISEFCSELAKALGCSDVCALDIWYARQRSWFRWEMVDELLRLDASNDTVEFRPNLCSGEFKWDETNLKFVPKPSKG